MSYDVQDTPDYDSAIAVSGGNTIRGTKGNRVEQGKRYRLRYPSKYRDRMRRYMAYRRASLREASDA